jgi:hypothetical protein
LVERQVVHRLARESAVTPEPGPAPGT